MILTVGIWGCGVVGGNTARLFEERGEGKIEIIKYDKFKEGQWATPKELTERSDFIFICLPTPMKETGEIDLSYIEAALYEINKYVPQKISAASGKIIVIRSTVVPGSTNRFMVKFPLLNIVVVPEFLTEAHAWDDIVNTSRIVIGTNDRIVFTALKTLFSIVHESVDFILMESVEAELYKYACNYFLSMTSLAATELFFICKALGVDYRIIQKYLKYDKRIGTHTEVPGPDGDVGIGGKCLPKDLSALAHLASKNNYTPILIDAGISLNERTRTNKDWKQIKGAVSDCKFNKVKL